MFLIYTLSTLCISYLIFDFISKKIKIIDKTNRILFFFTILNKNKLKLKNINISLFKPDVKKLREGNNNKE